MSVPIQPFRPIQPYERSSFGGSSVCSTPNSATSQGNPLPRSPSVEERSSSPPLNYLGRVAPNRFFLDLIFKTREAASYFCRASASLQNKAVIEKARNNSVKVEITVDLCFVEDVLAHIADTYCDKQPDIAHRIDRILQSQLSPP